MKYDWEIERDAQYAAILEETNREMHEFHMMHDCEAHVEAYYAHHRDQVLQTVQEYYTPF